MVTTSRCIEHFLWLELYQNQGLYTTRQTNRRNFSQDRAINDTTVDNGRLIHILNHFLDHRVSDPVFLVIVFEIRSRYVALAYMTGILPIKKYGSHSALNMFTEYSMTDPDELARCDGFRYTKNRQCMREKSLTFGDFFFTLKALLLCAVPLFRSSSSDLAADYNVSLCGQNGNPAAYGALHGDEVSLHSLQLQSNHHMISAY